MNRSLRRCLAVLLLGTGAAAQAETRSEVLERAGAQDWRSPDAENLLYLELGSGRVVIELAPRFAPAAAARIRALARAGYFDGLAVIRSQDNYVAQWGDPRAGSTQARPLPDGITVLPAEYRRPMTPELPFHALPDGDVYATEAGFVDGFAAARDPEAGRIWLAHCYGALGVGRGMPPDAGDGSELYVVTGHAPRHLDRNITVAGRVLLGMEHLSSLPRGHGPLGFYTEHESAVPIRSIRVAADLPAAQRTVVEVLRTDRPIFADYVASRRSRTESWFVEPVDRIELCNVGVPVREKRESP